VVGGENIMALATEQDGSLEELNQASQLLIRLCKSNASARDNQGMMGFS
jgi:hypothetical protein